MDRKLFVGALAVGLALGWASATALASQTQTPSLKIEVGLGVAFSETDAPFALSCEGFSLPVAPEQEDEQSPEPEPAMIPVTVFGFDVQTPPYDWDGLLTLSPGEASLWQTPSMELETGLRAGHLRAEWGQDVNGDAIADAVFYFAVTDVFATQEACATAQGLHFETQIGSGSGALILYGDAAFALPESVEAPSEPAPANAVTLSLSRAYAVQNGKHAFTFVAHGVGIEAVAVEVFSLSGARVFDSGFSRGNALQWHGLDAAGQRVANGVYLYVMTVRNAAGQTLRGKVQKLVVLR